MEANVMIVNTECGLVAYQINGGKYGVLELLEEYSELESLKVIEGDLESLGEKVIVNIHTQKKIKVFVKNFGMNRADALWSVS